MRAPLAARRRIGYVPERPALHLELTVDGRARLRRRAARRAGGRRARRAVDDAHRARAGSTTCAARRIGALSRGMRQRVEPRRRARRRSARAPPRRADGRARPRAERRDAPPDPRARPRPRRARLEPRARRASRRLCDRVVILHRGRVPRRAATRPQLAARLRPATARRRRGRGAARRARGAARATSPACGASSRVAGLDGHARCRVEVAPTATCAPPLAARARGRRRRALRARTGRAVARGGVPRPGATTPTGERTLVTKALAHRRRELAVDVRRPARLDAHRRVHVPRAATSSTATSRSTCSFGGGNLPHGLWRYVFLDYRLVALLVAPAAHDAALRRGAEARHARAPVEPARCATATCSPGSSSPRSSSTRACSPARRSGPRVLCAAAPLLRSRRSPAGYVGLLLLGLAFIACGLAASAVDREPGGERHAHLRRARVLLVRHLERGRDRRARRLARASGCRSSTASTASRRA